MHVLGAFLAGLVVATVTSPAVTPTNLLFNLFATPSGVLIRVEWYLGADRS